MYREQTLEKRRTLCPSSHYCNFIGTSVFDKPSTESSTKTLRYSDFIEAVQDKEISRVLISPDNATAQVVENDGSRSEVNLAPDKDLLKIRTEKI